MQQAPDEPQRAPSALSDAAVSADSALSASAPARRRRYLALWKARLELMRLGNCLMSALGVLTGIVIVPHRALPAATWLAGPAAAFLLAGFGNVLNDLRDRSLDAAAHPGRALPAGRIRVADARLWAAVLLLVGLGEAFLAAGVPTLAFALLNALALAAYELWFKRLGLPGNVLVALLVASTFAFGAVAAGAPWRAWGMLWLLMAMAFLANVARELLKDVEDAGADAGHRTTLPLQAGAGWTRLLAMVLANAAVLLSMLAFLHPPADWWRPWLLVLLASDLLFVVASARAWMHVGQAQRLLKAAMLAALAAFLAGPLVP